jgi:hypothetical protein
MLVPQELLQVVHRFSPEAEQVGAIIGFRNFLRNSFAHEFDFLITFDPLVCSVTCAYQYCWAGLVAILAP